MTQQPTLFLSHGGPNIVTDDTPARDHLRNLAATLPDRPAAIIIVSAHFETEGPVVVSDPNPGMIYDFRGFAPELYQMVYSAPGEPQLAERVAAMIAAAGLPAKLADQRGYDHGVWTPLLLAFPDADIPVVQLSVDPNMDAKYHYRLGQALAALGNENILLIGSGHITHNLSAFFSIAREGRQADEALGDKVAAFTGWMESVLIKGDTGELLDWKRKSPFPDDNHPTDEHLMPLFFAIGAAGDGSTGSKIHDSRQMGFFAFDCYRFDRRAVH